MPTYVLDVYDYNPSGVFPTTVSQTFVYGGPATATGTATVTDTQSGIDGQTLSALGSGETATADVTVGGNTSTGSNVDAEDAWTLRDTVTGQLFQVTSMEVRSGPAIGRYLVSEVPMIAGRTYEVVEYDNLPSASSGPILDYTEVVCFTPGVQINTPDGPRPIETLEFGDLVTTMDNGPQMIRWISHRKIAFNDGIENAKPIQIKAGAFARGMPERDIIVSPQHRFLVLDRNKPRENEVFVPAKALTVLPRIRMMQGRKTVEYIHFALDQHEVVIAEGIYTESCHMGPMVLQGIPKSQRSQIRAIFPRIKNDPVGGYGPTARPVLKVQQARKLLKTQQLAFHGAPRLFDREFNVVD